MIDRLRQLAMFAKTIDHGSFRGAAKELDLSPSVVSHHISQLEEHLGVALIYRSTRKLTLSLEGERLLVATRNMLAAVEGEFLEISGNANQPSGELRVTLPSVLSNSVLTDAIANFIVSHPSIDLSLDFSDGAKDLIDDGFDIAFRMWLTPKETANTKVLFSLPRKLVASADYLAGRPQAQNLDQLENWDWIVLSAVQKHRGIVFKSPNQKSIKAKPKVRVYANDARALYGLIQADAGIGVIPEFLVEQDVAAGKMQYLLPDWYLETVKVFAEWPTNAPKDGLVQLFITELSEFIEDNLV